MSSEDPHWRRRRRRKLLHSELLAFAHERTRILHEFAPAWLSKAVWQEGELTPRTFRRFFGYALEKVLRDISQERPVA
jgi:hypothetical protein